MAHVDEDAFKEAVWAVERESFRPGDALTAFERAKVDGPADADHHPALAESGELEIAQRQALHDAVEVARLGVFDSGDDQVRASVEAYLTSMRRHWQPTAHPIEIGDGDHIVVKLERGATVHLHNQKGALLVRPFPDALDIEIEIVKLGR